MNITGICQGKYGSSACLKFFNSDKELSIAFDDSCGAMQNLGRVSVAKFRRNSPAMESPEVFGPSDEEFLAILAEFLGFYPPVKKN